MFIGNIITTLLSVFMVKLLTNKLTVSDYGHYSLIMSFVSLPLMVAFAPLSAAIYPFIQKRKNINRYFNFQNDIFELFYLINIIMLLCASIAILLAYFFHNLNLVIVENIMLAILFSSTMGAVNILDTFSLANTNVRDFVVFPIINSTLKIVLVIILFKVDISPEGLVLLFSVLQSVLFVFEYKFLKKNKTINKISFPEIKKIIDFSEEKKEVVKYSLNFFTWGVFAWAQGFFDKWMLNQFATKNDIAVYSVYFQYGFFPFTVISSIFSQYITPRYFSCVQDKEELKIFMISFLKANIIFFISALLVIPFVSIFISPTLITLLTNSKYLIYIDYFPYVVIAGCFFGFGQILTVPLLSSELVNVIKLPKILSAVLSLLLLALLIPRHGVLGILISLMISNFIYFIILLIQNVKLLKSIR